MNIENRLENNRKILDKICEYINRYPDRRFIQVLWNLGIIDRDEEGNVIDRFYEEPNKTLLRLRKE